VSVAGVFLLHPENRPFLEGKAKLPRKIGPSGLLFYLLVGSVALGNVILTPILIVDLCKQSRLLSHGVKTEARVVRLRGQEDSAEKDGGEPADRFLVTYRFQAGPPGDRRAYELETPADERDYGLLRVGQTVDVMYDPADPNVSELQSKVADTQTSIGFVGFIAFCWLFVFVMLLLWWFLRWRPSRRAIREGRLLDGEVVRCTARSTEDHYHIRLRYLFTAPDGKTIEGDAQATRDDLEKSSLPAAGTPLRVFYFAGVHHVI
jgi:hypothetical protein